VFDLVHPLHEHGHDVSVHVAVAGLVEDHECVHRQLDGHPGQRHGQVHQLRQPQGAVRAHRSAGHLIHSYRHLQQIRHTHFTHEHILL